MKSIFLVITVLLTPVVCQAATQIEIPKDHQINGNEVFYDLKIEEAQRHGAALAKSDYEKGIKRIFVYGLRGGSTDIDRALAVKYQIYQVAIAGCIVSDGIIEGAKAYNETMKELLFIKYKKDVFKEVAAAERLNKAR
ncbi:MAG: hypothetical protein ACSHX8_00395 [Opitutaceae bacterium]